MNRLAFAARLKPTRRMSTTVVRHASTLASSEEKVMQDMIYRVRQINHMPEDIRSSLLDFTVDGIRLGRVSF